MAITFPISVADALSILGLTADSSPDIATAAVQSEIDTDADKVRDNCQLRGYVITSPTAHQTRILSLCNRFGAQAPIVLRRGAATDPEYLIFHIALEEMSNYLNGLTGLLRTGQLRMSFVNGAANTIPTASLATGAECAALVPSFTPSSVTRPTSTTMQDLADMFSAIVYSVAAMRGYPIPSNPATLTAAQQNCYGDIVQCFTASIAVRIRADEFGEASGVQHKLGQKLWDRAIEKLNDLRTGKKRLIFA